jgi:hypothetical protein
MKLLCLMCCLALAGGCSSFGVRCDSRLRPINPRQLQVSQPQKSESAALTPAPSSTSSQSVQP